MQPTRIVTLDPARPLHALTATARGMIDRTFVRAAQRAWTELMPAVAAAGLVDQVRSHLGLVPDDPRGSSDAGCRYLAGVLFGHDLATQQGTCLQPQVPLTGSLAWTPIAAGRYAVFMHVGPHDTLFRSWDAIANEWLPSSGLARRDAPSLELSLNLSEQVAPLQLRTEIWIPVS